MSERQTVAGAFEKIESHEAICAVRYTAINETLADLKDGAKTLNRLVVGVLLALLGWMATQLWTGHIVHPGDKAQAAMAVVAAVPK